MRCWMHMAPDQSDCCWFLPTKLFEVHMKTNSTHLLKGLNDSCLRLLSHMHTGQKSLQLEWKEARQPVKEHQGRWSSQVLSSVPVPELPGVTQRLGSSRTQKMSFTTTPFAYKTKRDTKEQHNFPGGRNSIWPKYHCIIPKQTELLALLGLWQRMMQMSPQLCSPFRDKWGNCLPLEEHSQYSQCLPAKLYW